MARKTNKTDHVLNLLVGTDTGTEKEEKKMQDGQEQTGQKPAAEGLPSAADKGSVHVVLSSIREGDPVAGIIKDKLEEELAKEELANEKLTNEALTNEETDAFREQKDLPPSVEAPEPDLPAEAQEAEPAGEPGPGTSPEPQEPALPAEAPEMEPAPGIFPEPQQQPEKAPEMEGYVFYNIMEKIVKDKAMNYMTQFGNCTCKRCEADTIALALSKLPPKYVVVEEDSVSPLVNFYEDHYAGQIIVEITKACIMVNKNPRHRRK